MFFLHVKPKPADSTDAQAAADTAAMELQRSLLRQLQHQERAKDAAGPDDLHAELHSVFALAAAQQVPDSYLLVLDDVWDKSIIDHLRCTSMRGVILVTSVASVFTGAACSQQLQADTDSKQAAQQLMAAILAGTGCPQVGC